MNVNLVKRILSLILTVALLLGNVPAVAFATEVDSGEFMTEPVTVTETVQETTASMESPPSTAQIQQIGTAEAGVSTNFTNRLSKTKLAISDDTFYGTQISRDAIGFCVPMEAQDTVTGSSESTPVVGTMRSIDYGYKGSYNNITWLLNMSTGVLTVNGSGAVLYGWYDSTGNSLGAHIKTVTIGSGITAIGEYAFANCTNLSSVTIPSTVTSIGYAAFAYCSALKSVSIPSEVSTLDAYSFYFCTALEKVALPQKLTTIGEYAFTSCEKLTAISIPAGVTSIGMGAFSTCAALKSVIYPAGCTSVSDYTFYGCKAVAALTIPDSVTHIGEYAFTSCESLTELVLPRSVTTIGNAAFALCTKLKTATIHGNTGEMVFHGCTALETVSIGAHCTAIGSLTFNLCTALKSITIPDSCTSFGEQAFGGCRSLEAIQFPATLQRIGAFCFYSCVSLKEAVFPEGLKEIGSTAFGGEDTYGWCENLTYVKIPASLDRLGEYCFEKCSALKTVEFPQVMTGQLNTLEKYTFTQCTSLEKIRLPDQITLVGEGCFGHCSNMTELILPQKLASIGAGAFGLCTSLTQVLLPDTCTAISEQAFYGCTSLQEIILPEGTTAAANAVFYGCTNLKKAVLPQTLTSLGEHTFAKCETLSDVTVPEAVHTIGKYCFSECTVLSAATIPAGVTRIEEGTFNSCVKLAIVELPDNITEVGSFAFYDCAALTKIALPNTVTRIGEAAFIHCISLEEIVLPTELTQIEDGTFHTCSGLKSVTTGEKITAIGELAFANCENLLNFRFPNSITSVGSKAFANCLLLSDVEFPESLVSIEDTAFANCLAIQEISIGKNLTEIAEYVFSGCTALKKITVAVGNSRYMAADGILYNKDQTVLEAYPAGRDDSSFAIPTSVKKLSAGAFYGCTALETVTLPESITEIPDHAFYGCQNLTHIDLHDGITSIGMYALSKCDHITQITLPDSVTSIGAGTFNDNPGIAEVRLSENLKTLPEYLFTGCSNLTKVNLPDSLETIEKYAFACCAKLADITLPGKLRLIGEAAFSECDQLRSLILPVGVEYIDALVFRGCDALEELVFEGNISVIGNYAFYDAKRLKNVQFSGAAPEVIGESAFDGTDGDLTLHFPSAATNWTTPEWIGPDRKTYKTTTTHSGDCGENVAWTLSTYNGLLTISGTGDTYEWSSAEAVPWNALRNQIRSVVISEGVTRLGAFAFIDCKNLTAITAAESVTAYGYGVFAECPSLTKVTTISGLRQISDCMFYNCAQLSAVEIAGDVTQIGEYAFYGCHTLQKIQIPQGVTVLEEGTFANCLLLENVVFLGQIEKLSAGAFLNCGNIRSLYFTGAIPTDIHEYAFYAAGNQATIYSASDVETWTTPSGNTIRNICHGSLSGSCGSSTRWEISPSSRTLSISGNGAMQDYTSGTTPWQPYADLIDSIVISSGITQIGAYAFEDMGCVQNLSIAQTVSVIGDYAFSDCAEIVSVNLPGGLVTLGEGAFSGCICLKKITIPEGVSEIQPYTFMLCEQLAQVDIPSGVTSIGYAAFYTCPNLQTISLPRQLQLVDDWAFAHCVILKTILLPDSVTSVGEYAFFDCVKLQSADLGCGLAKIDKYAFSQTALVEVDLPESLTSISECAFELCDQLTTVTFAGESITVGESAFYGCSAMNSIDLENVVSIGKLAFAASGLTSVMIPEQIAFIGDYAFADCQNLTQFLSDSDKYPAMQGILYFGNILLQYPAGKAGTSFTVPATVSGIAPGAFYGCGTLVSVSIGKQVEHIGEAAFALCDSLTEVFLGEQITVLEEAVFGDCASLTKVNFNGNAPEVKTDAFYNTHENLTLYYPDTGKGWTNGSWIASDGQTYRTVMRVSSMQYSLDLKENLQTAGEQYITFNTLVHSSQHTQNQKAILILAMYKDQKMLTSDSREIQIQSDSSYLYVFRVAAAENSALTYKLFLLDAQTNAPLAEAVCYSSAAELSGYTGDNLVEVVIRPEDGCPELPEVDPDDDSLDDILPDILQPAVSNEPLTDGNTLFQQTLRSTDTAAFDDVQYAATDEVFSGKEIAFVIDTYEAVQTTAFSNGTPSSTESYGTMTTLTFDVSNIEQFGEALLNGTLKPTKKPEIETPFSVETDVLSVSKSTYFKEGEFSRIPTATYNTNGDVTMEGSTVFSRFELVGSGTVNGIKFEGTLLKPPSASLAVGGRYTVLENRSTQVKAHQFGRVKIKQQFTSTLGSVDASLTAGGSTSVVNLGIKAGITAAEIGDKFSFCTEDGTELFSVGLSTGVGLGAQASGIISKENVKLKFGAKLGLGGAVSIEINPKNLVKKLGDAVLPTIQQNYVNHLFVVKTVCNNVVTGIQCFNTTVSGDGVLLQLLKMPLIMNSAISTEVLNVALPRSDGGARMPEPTLVGSQNGGNANGSVVSGTMTEEEKQEVSQKVTLTEKQKLDIIIALVRNSWYGIPLPVDIHAIIANETFRDLGINNQFIQTVWTQTSLKSPVLGDVGPGF